MLYKCYICGRGYDNPVDAANCTISCSQSKENTAIQKELYELKEKIDDTYKTLKTLCHKYNELSRTENIEVSMRNNIKTVYINEFNCMINDERDDGIFKENF